MKRLDTDTSENWLKFGLMGPSGSGKTWAGTTAPKPLILIWERQAKASIEASCAARGLKRPMMVLIESIHDVGNVLRAVHADRTKPFVIREQRNREALIEFDEWPETLVIDSITDACAMQRDEMLAEAPPRKDPDTGIADESFAHRRQIKDRCIQLIRHFRNVPAHVVFLALEEDKKIYRGRKEVGEKHWPQLPDKELPGTLMAATNAFGRMFRGRPDKDGVSLYGTAFEAPPEYAVKTFPPLRKREPAIISEWVGRIHGTWTGPVSEAPIVTEELEEEPYAPEPEPEDIGESGAQDHEPAEDAPQPEPKPRKRGGRKRKPMEVTEGQQELA